MGKPVDDLPDWITLRSGGTLLALDATPGERPAVVYAGPDIANADSEKLALLATRQHAPGTPSEHQPGSLANEVATGIAGPWGLECHREGLDWAPDLRVVEVRQDAPDQLELRCEDQRCKIATTHRFALDPQTGMLTASTEVENLDHSTLQLDWCASLCLPVDDRLNRFLSFTGRWANEFQLEEVPAFHGSMVRENRAGRTSHSSYPGALLAAQCTTEQTGPAMGLHLAWSGNHRLRVDRHPDGRSFAMIGELGFPGEFRLAAGEAYRSPDCLVAFSCDGLNGVSHKFHDHLLDKVLDPRTHSKPRPVHFNTWEAVYFGHDEKTLIELAEAAADVGVERFVLDDGWFGGRRSDAAGLGDWWVSSQVYPDGLHPLVNCVRELGMEFGLWFEPEMVNPDSDLYRNHPDWVLGVEGVEPIASRNQLVLDLTREEVRDYLFAKIDALVNEYNIDYIKWDMNRDIQHPGSAGRAVAGKQTRAVYALINALRKAHPTLEIESCSSGGARADFGILAYTDRVWTSDNNDTRARQSVQRGASHFLPLRVVGSHVGPKRCHITGRKFSMAFRVASAVFGHMGLEVDLRRENERDLATLKAGIELYKRHRNLIHGGRFHRLDSAGPTNLVGCVSHDQSEALFSYAVLDIETDTLPRPIRFGGLDPDKNYRVRLAWPEHNPSISHPSIIDSADLMVDGTLISGAALMDHGMQPPLTLPDTALIYHLATEA